MYYIATSFENKRYIFFYVRIVRVNDQTLSIINVNHFVIKESRKSVGEKHWEANYRNFTADFLRKFCLIFIYPNSLKIRCS